ncbi:MAG: ABC transporter substrate-binding protein [Deinococcota bacterium]
MKRVFIGLFLLLGLATAQEGTLELAVDQSPVGLDPHVVTAFSSFAVLGQIYDGLVEINANLQVEPGLATSWDISDDGLTYTFTLREGVTFHNGRPFTAEDVVYSFERIMDEATGSPQASRFSQVTSAEATDDFTVVFTLSESFAPFLGNTANLSVVAREVAESEDLSQVAVGTGPFTLAEVVPDTYVLLEAFDGYYRADEPKLAALRYNVVPEAATRAAGLRTGTYHLLPDVDPATAQTLEGTSGVTILSTQDLAYSLLGFNTTVEPFDDPRVREAINLIINREEIVEAVYFGQAVPGGPLSPGLSDWALDTSAYSCYQYDLDRAAALLEDAGASDLSFEILSFGTNRIVSDATQVIQAQLVDAGIDATINIEEFGNFVQRWRNSDFDTFVSLNGGNADPDGYLYRTFHSTGATNIYQFNSSEVDALLDQGRRQTSFDERSATYTELQELLACTGPVVHVAYGTLLSAVRDNVAGFEQMPTRSLRSLREVSLQ